MQGKCRRRAGEPVDERFEVGSIARESGSIADRMRHTRIVERRTQALRTGVVDESVMNIVFPRPDELHRSAGQPRQLGDLYEVFRDWVSITAGSGAVHRYPFARQAREIAEGMTYPLLSPRIPCTARHPRLAAAVVKPDGRIHRLRRDADGMRQDIFRDDRRILAVERSGRPFD